MTTFIKPPKRPATEHDECCTRPGWLVQARIGRGGRLIKTCRGCTAVTTVRANEARQPERNITMTDPEKVKRITAEDERQRRLSEQFAAAVAPKLGQTFEPTTNIDQDEPITTGDQFAAAIEGQI